MSARAWAFQRGILYAIDFVRSEPTHVWPRIAVRFTEVQPSAVEPLARAMALRDTAEVARSLEIGRRCFAGWLDGQIVTYGWVSQRDERVGELERTYQLWPGDAYIWNCATQASQRGQGLYSALLSCITLTLRGENVKRVWIGSNLENRASLRAFARVGFQAIMHVTYMRLLSLCGLWMHPQRTAPTNLVGDARHMLIAPHERAWGSLTVGFVMPPDWPLVSKPKP